MKRPSITAIERAAASGDVLVSAVTAWEIGMLCAVARLVARPSPEQWFSRLLQRPGLQLAPLTPDWLMMVGGVGNTRKTSGMVVFVWAGPMCGRPFG